MALETAFGIRMDSIRILLFVKYSVLGRKLIFAILTPQIPKVDNFINSS